MMLQVLKLLIEKCTHKHFVYRVFFLETQMGSYVHFFYILVFYRWSRDKFTKLYFYQGGKPIVPAPDMMDGLQIVLKNMASHIQKEFPNTLKFWRLQSPRHFHGGDWNQNGTCLFDKPLNSPEVCGIL